MSYKSVYIKTFVRAPRIGLLTAEYVSHPYHSNTKIQPLVFYNIKRGLKTSVFNPSGNSNIFLGWTNDSLSGRTAVLGSSIPPSFGKAHLEGKNVGIGYRYMSGGSGIAKYLVTPLLGKLGSILWKEGFRGPENSNRSIRQFLKTLFILGITLFPFFFFYHVEEVYNPEIKRKRFLLFKSTAQLKQIESTQYRKWMNIFEENGLDRSSPMYTRVKSIKNQIIKSNNDLQCITKTEWKVYIIKGETPQAKVYSNGDIFITTKTIEVSVTDTEIAIILGRGMAHCALSHAAEKYSRSMLKNVTTFIPLVAIWIGIPYDSFGFGDLLAVFWHWKILIFADEFEAIYNTEMQKEAEQFAIKLLAKSGYEVDYGRSGNKHLKIFL